MSDPSSAQERATVARRLARLTAQLPLSAERRPVEDYDLSAKARKRLERLRAQAELRAQRGQT